MRKVIYYLTASLDGFIARPDGTVDWLLEAEGEDFGFAEFFETIDTVVMGRKTYETALSFGPYPYSSKRSFIFSQSMTQSDHAQIVQTSVTEFVSEQKKQSGKDIWLVGGAEIAKAFFEANAIDQLIVFVQPILLGTGLPIVQSPGRDLKLRLIASQEYPAGLMRLDYQVSQID